MARGDYLVECPALRGRRAAGRAKQPSIWGQALHFFWIDPSSRRSVREHLHRSRHSQSRKHDLPPKAHRQTNRERVVWRNERNIRHSRHECGTTTGPTHLRQTRARPLPMGFARSRTHICVDAACMAYPALPMCLLQGGRRRAWARTQVVGAAWCGGCHMERGLCEPARAAAVRECGRRGLRLASGRLGSRRCPVSRFWEDGLRGPGCIALTRIVVLRGGLPRMAASARVFGAPGLARAFCPPSGWARLRILYLHGGRGSQVAVTLERCRYEALGRCPAWVGSAARAGPSAARGRRATGV